MSLDLTKPIRRKSDRARAVVLDSWYVAVKSDYAGWFTESLDYDCFENVPQTVEVWSKVDSCVVGGSSTVMRFGNCQHGGDNLKLTFEGDRLVSAEVIR